MNISRVVNFFSYKEIQLKIGNILQTSLKRFPWCNLFLDLKLISYLSEKFNHNSDWRPGGDYFF